MRFETDHNTEIGGEKNPWVVSCRRTANDKPEALAAFSNETTAREHEKSLNKVYHAVLEAIMPDPMELVAAINAGLLEGR